MNTDVQENQTPTNRCAFPWQGMIIDVTGEVLPCPYYHLSSDGKCLGNTNKESLEEIWNGDGYMDLRRRHQTGDLEGHPCGTCYITRLNNGVFPKFEWGSGFRHETGKCFIAQVPEDFWERHKERVDDMVVLENGLQMELRTQLADDVRTIGAGHHCFWQGYLYLSTSDGSHPGTNGRTYSVRVDSESVEIGRLRLNTPSADNVIANHTEFLKGRQRLATEPSKIWFIETTDCNIDCPACSQNELRLVGTRHRTSTGADVRARIPKLQELIWHGGEPYMISAFRDFVRAFDVGTNPNLSFGFMSNGLMITEMEAAHLDRFPHFNITISIDSFVPETYEKMRPPAKFSRVEESLHRLLRLQQYPDRKVTVAMIIGKTNFRDIAYNLDYARRHHIRMMINPIYQYPPTEKLNLFSDFEAETEGWEVAIETAKALVDDARRNDAQFLRQLDCGKAVAELDRVYRSARDAYSDCQRLVVTLNDPHGTLGRMRRPGILVRNEGTGHYEAIAFSTVGPGDSDVVVAVPRNRIQGPVIVDFFPDIHELGSSIEWAEPVKLDSQEHTEIGPFELPAYSPPPRHRNIMQAKRGRRRQTYEITEHKQLMTAYKLLSESEASEGFGFLADVPAEPPQAPPDEPQAPLEQPLKDVGVKGRWRHFLVDFFRPYAGPDKFSGLSGRR